MGVEVLKESIAQVDPELLQVAQEQQEEVQRLLNSDLGEGLESLGEQIRLAVGKFQKLSAEVESALDWDEMQAKVMLRHLNEIKRFEHLIRAAQQRFDAIISELDRHRFMRKNFESAQTIEAADFRGVNPKAVQKTTNKKLA